MHECIYVCVHINRYISTYSFYLSILQAWDPFCPEHLYSSLENGDVVVIDVRMTDKPLVSFSAHDETVSQISFSSSVPGKHHLFIHSFLSREETK